MAAMIGLPLITITAYLLWVWPRPHGTSPVAELAPYLVSLLTGAPFAWMLGAGASRGWRVFTFMGVGFVVLWIYALAVLCGVRGICL